MRLWATKWDTHADEIALMESLVRSQVPVMLRAHLVWSLFRPLCDGLALQQFWSPASGNEDGKLQIVDSTHQPMGN